MSEIEPTMNMNLISSSSSCFFDEQRWVIQIRKTLDEQVLEEEIDIPACIFNVPKKLLATDPYSYIPQHVALGPYHYWRPELYETQRHKLAAAKRTQKQLPQDFKFQYFVDELAKLEPRIRGCYHKYLDYNGETLAWMMAIDAAFLLEFIQTPVGRKSAHEAILRDLVMLENQIPMFLLTKLLEFLQFSPAPESADKKLFSMLMGLCKEISPFKTVEKFPNSNLGQCPHLLDFLYHAIVPKLHEPPSEFCIKVDDQQSKAKESKEEEEGSQSFGNSNQVKQLLVELWKMIQKSSRGPLHGIKRILLSGPVQVILKLPWTIISNLPGLRLLKPALEYLFFSQNTQQTNQETQSSISDANVNKPPLVEEIAIPSVTELSSAGVRFSPTNGSVMSIAFNAASATLYLPAVRLEANTEVTLRNLVAYEACNESGPLIFSRYTELMNGIIDTAEDARLLRGRGIILNHLKSDGEAADLWNGMCKSVRLTRVPFLDKVIEDVNKYHNGRWKVKLRGFLRLYVFESWKFLTLLGAVLLLLFMSLQELCSVYSCARMFHIKSI
ncbi:putative UPF0481 protein At3g02645 [Diospyros lotus]|uniref:putative UPF0481 protein At3g02645 n=1 Tax=Diospyros lotus TaxID=55363 RepID=UPI00225308BE|nr:putative UPF0481 protein At3g02645 [Diospyros lotus]